MCKETGSSGTYDVIITQLVLPLDNESEGASRSFPIILPVSG
jgi:hypothetical protein